MRIGNRLLKRRNVALLAVTAAVIGVMNCGEPLGPLEARWVNVADFPPDISRVNAISPFWLNEEVGVYAVAERRGAYDALVKCSRHGFSTEFEMNERYDDGCLADVAGYGGSVWISGAKVSGKITAPFVLRKPNLGEWKEIPVPYHPGAAVSAVVPINESDCWFLIDDRYGRGTHEGTLAKYAGGAVTTYEGFGDVTVVRTVDPGRPERLYAVTCGGEPVKVFVTADEGASWAEETLPRDVVRGHSVRSASAATAAGPDLYVILGLGHEGEIGGTYSAVVKRTGPPGVGEYAVAFLAPPGPYFAGITSMAFIHPGYRSYGIGVGSDTTVLFDEGNVYLERLPYRLKFNEVVLSAAGGFLSVGMNEAFGGYELLYHP